MPSLLMKDGHLVMRSGALVTTENPAECDCCGGEVTPCCEGYTLPGTLYVRAVGRDGCECIDEDFEIDNPDPTTSNLWCGFQVSCDASGSPWQLCIDCVDGVWTAAQSACRVGSGNVVMSVTSCNPFSATFALEKQFGSEGYCCEGFVDFEISETPFP